MAIYFLHPRRRGLLFKALCVLTFLGFMSLWFMADSNSGGRTDEHPGAGGRSPREAAPQPLDNHIDGGVGAGIEAPVGGELPAVGAGAGGVVGDHGDHSRDRILNHIENSVNNFNLKPQYPKKVADPLLVPGGAPALPVPGHPDELERRRAEAMFAEDEAKVVPGLGEFGKAVHMTGEELARAEEVIKVEAFNKILSDKISVNRTVPDSRDPLCKRLSYDSDLPSASVVIIFTNEAWTPLIRTVHSVLNRSPLQHLRELLLVDDFSDKKELGEKLELYIKYRLPAGKVRLVRLPSRHGLIRARLAGAREAKGDVLIFLDSHCECNTLWMEPLLQRIKDSRSAVLVPIIDVIDDKTLEYYAGNGRYFQVGGFTWSGHFTWIEISQQEDKRRGSPVAPTRSPTMAGGLFAIDRNYFWEVGGYDEGMDVWGGENLEMSFRVWMCGGTLETLPCSRVGHIFRSFHPYTFPGNKDTHGLNTARLAEVWMDDYKRLFYMNRPELETADWGDVTPRRNFRRQLQCHSFKWYLDNIYPEKFILDEESFAYGRLRNNATTPNLCLDTLQADEKKRPFEMGLYNCHTFLAASQYMSLSHAGELRREDVCAEVPQSYQLQTKSTMRMAKCHGNKGNQEWVMTKSGHLLHKASNLCLHTANKISMASVSVTECRATASQQWWFDHYSVG